MRGVYVLNSKVYRAFKLVEKCARLLFELLLSLALIFLIYVSVSQYVFGQIVLAVVRGSSMEPLLRDRDIVMLEHSPKIELGDIVVYRNDYNELVVHRVVAIVYCKDGKVLYITKGDNNPYLDIEIPGIARKSSIKCHAKFVDTILGLNAGIPSISENSVVKGISYSRIVGKVIEVLGYPLKITGLTILSSG